MNTLELLNIKVKDVMTKDVISVFENDTMQTVSDIINSSIVSFYCHRVLYCQWRSVVLLTK